MLRLRKCVSFIMVMLMVFSVAATAYAQETLVVWMPPLGAGDTTEQAFWEEVLGEWGTENECTIQFELIPWANYEEKYLTAVTSGTGPDVGYMYMEMIMDYIEMGALVAMDEFITEEDRENYLYLDNGVIQREQYMFPIVVGNPRLFYYNKIILAESGFTTPPETWEELVEYGLKIKEDNPDVWPFALPWANQSVGALNVLFLPFLWQADGELIDENNEWAFNSAAGIEAVDFLKSLIYDSEILPVECLSQTQDDLNNRFCDGQLAMYISDELRATSFDEAGIDWGYLPSLSYVTDGTFIASDALVMLSSTENQELAYQCIQFMTSGEILSRFHTEISSFPPVGADEEYSGDSRFEDMYSGSSVEVFNTLPAMKGSSRVLDALYKNLQLVMLDQMDAADALNDAVSYANLLD